MSRSVADDLVRLEPHRFTPAGGLAPRCQVVKKNGAQCGAMARRGFRVRPPHSAGFAAREARGERRPAGRPPTHGLYSRKERRKTSEVFAELDAIDFDLDDTDAEMRLMRAALTYMLGNAERFSSGGDTAHALLDRFEEAAVAGPVPAAEAAALARAMGKARAVMSECRSWVGMPVVVARGIVTRTTGPIRA